MSDSKIRELFGRYGDVLDLDPHTTDPSVVYVVSTSYPHSTLSLSLLHLEDDGHERSRRGGGQVTWPPDITRTPSSGREIRELTLKHSFHR